MKKIMFAAVSALALSALADGVGSTQFGALTVVSKTKRTLVAIPWCEASMAGTDIAVSNLVLTANLQADDTLDIVNPTTGKSLNRWTLKKGSDDILYWYNGTMVTEDDNVAQTPSSDSGDATVPRGSAVVLIRNGENRDYNAQPFYVMGQVASGTPKTTITAGTTNAPCYNMIAPPSTTSQYLNGSEHAATWTGTIDKNDRIIIPTQYLNIELKYNENNWCYSGTTTVTNYYKAVYNDDTKKWDLKKLDEKEIDAFESISTETRWIPYTTAIPLGTGFWYVSCGGSPTVTWSDVPTK